jgi:IMP dehydrogenase
MRLKKALSFDDVLLVPLASDIESRKEVTISSNLPRVPNLFSLPVISSPMDTVTGLKMVCEMGDRGGLGVIHRYNSIEDQVEIVRSAIVDNQMNPYSIAAAVGASGDFVGRSCALWDAGARIICLDVAHGHHILVKKALMSLREIFGSEIHLMAGNVATLEAFDDLADWGADSIRVGIGGGSICSTRIQTGHGVPTFQSILDCSKSNRDAAIIADGGIRNSGDIVKALAAGANFVMIGSLLSGTNETPGEVFKVGKNKVIQVKSYRGMSSAEAQMDWRGSVSSREGITTTVRCKGPVRDILDDLAVGIRSGLSYSGVRNITNLQAKCQFIRQTSAGSVESSPHILNR